MVMKSNGILTMSGDDEVGQHIISINKPGPQEILSIKKMGTNIHKINLA